MNKMRLIFTLALALTCGMVQAVGISDIPAIQIGAYALYRDAVTFLAFAQKLSILDDAGFTFTIIDSTQTVSLTNAQKSGLIAEYQNIKQRMSDHFNQLP